MKSTGLRATHGGVIVPRDVIMDILNLYQKMEEVMATLEIMADQNTLKSIKKSKEQISKKQFLDADIHTIENTLG